MTRANPVFLVCMLLAAPAAAITSDQLEDFDDGQAGGWLGAPNQVASNGQLGPNDLFLDVMSSGASSGGGGRLVSRNISAAWTGDYLGAEVVAIEADLINLGSTDLEIRLGISGPGGAFSSSGGLPLATGSGWQMLELSLLPDDLVHVSGGAGDLDATLAAVSELRLFHSTFPAFGSNAAPGSLSPPPISAQIGIDNIRTLPEPSATLLGLTALGMLFARARRARGPRPGDPATG